MKTKASEHQAKNETEAGQRETNPASVDSVATSVALPVFQIKKILVPVDFSGCSKKALQYAIPFARQFGAELTLIHILQPYPPIPEMGPVDVETVQDAHEQLAEFQRSIGDTVPSHALVRTGNAHTEIVDAAKELGTDLILLSTHGRTGLAHVLLGSTAEKVVRHAWCPVLIVREHGHDFVVDKADNA